ncbi:MAG: DUF2225 domain-containing protein [Lachnospiraceae bacterium]|nr:DUF2225 domain-containing protein [Lachnospiraceae bacterium]
MSEADKVFKKSYKCPICDSNFKCLTVKQGKARMVSSDIDLKVNYRDIEPLKYDIILCPVCGYAALERYFDRVSAFQRKNIIDKICQSFSYVFEDKDEFTFDDAIVRYKFAVLTSQVKMSKASEFGFLCLKMGWLYRSYADSLDESMKKKKAELKEQEKTYLTNAFNYFETARAKEQSPICGMDEITFDTLLASLCVELDKKDEAKKYMSIILSNRNATKRVKDKIFDLKELLDGQSGEEDE